MGWLLELKDKNGVDLYPEIKSRIGAKMEDPEFKDKVRFDYIRNFGYYCTESSEHNAEYNGFYIKSKYPELIDRYNIPLDEYPRRCVNQIDGWKKEYAELMEKGVKEHTRSREYASHIMEAVVTDKAYQIGGKCIKYQSSDFQSSGRSMCRGTVPCQRLWHSSVCGRITSGSVCSDEYDQY